MRAGGRGVPVSVSGRRCARSARCPRPGSRSPCAADHQGRARRPAGTRRRGGCGRGGSGRVRGRWSAGRSPRRGHAPGASQSWRWPGLPANCRVGGGPAGGCRSLGGSAQSPFRVVVTWPVDPVTRGSWARHAADQERCPGLGAMSVTTTMPDVEQAPARGSALDADRGLAGSTDVGPARLPGPPEFAVSSRETSLSPGRVVTAAPAMRPGRHPHCHCLSWMGSTSPRCGRGRKLGIILARGIHPVVVPAVPRRRGYDEGIARRHRWVARPGPSSVLIGTTEAHCAWADGLPGRAGRRACGRTAGTVGAVQRSGPFGWRGWGQARRSSSAGRTARHPR
ncbi:hypothetical protein FrEUN1fDRAFT_4744 [Parafrankia sp. EUN1f]|nr:hypothetical protein FrEUN1fDRAFT_4744 [Parafrankia sp. EUN1f]